MEKRKEVGISRQGWWGLGWRKEEGILCFKNYMNYIETALYYDNANLKKIKN